MLNTRYRPLIIFILSLGYYGIYKIVRGSIETNLTTLYHFLFIFSTASIAWEVHRYTVQFLERIIPFTTQTMSKLFAAQTITAIGFPTLSAAGCFYIYVNWIFPMEYSQWGFPFRFSILICILANALLTAGVVEYKFISNWRESELETSRFKELSSKAQLESLKNQINPHFFFNNLNILSVLIDQSQELSKEFIDRFSDVFRYILKSNGRELVKVSEEIEFIQSYIFLLSVRFDDNLKVEIDPHFQKESRFIPPVVLHTLLENVIKHNIISQKQTLHVSIRYLTNEYIEVKNTLQRKNHIITSTKIGLESISKRYEFFSDRKVIIKEDDQWFTVQVPLIDLV